jgi:hypothetical protein
MGMHPGQTEQASILFNSTAGTQIRIITLTIQDGPEICVQPDQFAQYDPRGVMRWDQFINEGEVAPVANFDLWNSGLGELLYTIRYARDGETYFDAAPYPGRNTGNPVAHQVWFQSQAMAPGAYYGEFVIDDTDTLTQIGPYGRIFLTIASATGAFPLLGDQITLIKSRPGSSPDDRMLEVSNPGTGVLDYEWQTDQSWVQVVNPRGNLAKEQGKRQHELRFQVAHLREGRYPFQLTFTSNAGSKSYEMELEITEEPTLCLKSETGLQTQPQSLQISWEQLLRQSNIRVEIANCGGEALPIALQSFQAQPASSVALKSTDVLSQESTLLAGESVSLMVQSGRTPSQEGVEVWAVVNPTTEKILGYIEIGTESEEEKRSW